MLVLLPRLWLDAVGGRLTIHVSACCPHLQFQKIVETGAVTPQVTSSVPKPIAVALCEDQHGMHSHDLWPGAALGFNFANMQPDDEEPRDLSPEEVAKFKAELTAEEFEDFMAQEPKMAVPAVA